MAVALAETPQHADELTLIVDMGTNAEILLGDQPGVSRRPAPPDPRSRARKSQHGQRAAPGAIERVRIDPITLEPRFKLIGQEYWSDAVPPGDLPPSV